MNRCPLVRLLRHLSHPSFSTAAVMDWSRLPNFAFHAFAMWDPSYLKSKSAILPSHLCICLNRNLIGCIGYHGAIPRGPTPISNAFLFVFTDSRLPLLLTICIPGSIFKARFAPLNWRIKNWTTGADVWTNDYSRTFLEYGISFLQFRITHRITRSCVSHSGTRR